LAICSDDHCARTFSRQQDHPPGCVIHQVVDHARIVVKHHLEAEHRLGIGPARPAFGQLFQVHQRLCRQLGHHLLGQQAQPAQGAAMGIEDLAEARHMRMGFQRLHQVRAARSRGGQDHITLARRHFHGGSPAIPRCQGAPGNHSPAPARPCVWMQS